MRDDFVCSGLTDKDLRKPVLVGDRKGVLLSLITITDPFEEYAWVRFNGYAAPETVLQQKISILERRQ